jgi:hypothetical protein
VFLGVVFGLVDQTRSFLDRFTPNLLGGREIGTCSRGISSWIGLKICSGTIRFTTTGVDHFQKPENDVLPIFGHRHLFETKPSGPGNR